MMNFREVRKKETKLQTVVGIIAGVSFLLIPILFIISAVTRNTFLIDVLPFVFGFSIVLSLLSQGKLLSRTYLGSGHPKNYRNQ